MRLSLRIKLSLISLLLLAIPLIGFRFGEIITDDLMESRRETLLFSARAVASTLAGRTGLLEQELFHSLNQSRDLYLFQLTGPIRLNGKTDDWKPQLLQAEDFGKEHLLQHSVPYNYNSLHFKHLLGVRGKYLYALFIVTDDNVVYRQPDSLIVDRADHLQIGIEDRNGTMHRYLVATSQPGWVNGFRMPENPEEKFPVVLEKNIQGVWAETPEGYIIELRIPRDLTGDRLAFAIGDVDSKTNRETTTLIGTAKPEDPEKLGWLLSPARKIESILETLDRPQSRILIVDTNQRVRASFGSLAADEVQHENSTQGLPELIRSTIYTVLEPLYHLFTTPFTSNFDTPTPLPTTLDISGVRESLQGKSSVTKYRIAEGQVEIMAAIAPIIEDGDIIGAVIVEQTTNSILALQNRVIEESLSFTILVFCIGAFSLLLFASRLSSRIRVLRDNAAEAITESGQIKSTITPAKERDEIGDLSRTLASMLIQLKEQSDYRETMADNLEHEMRTPLAGISASLRNLKEAVSDPENSIADTKYLDWAMQDVVRLENLLSAIRDATNLQDALERDEPEQFNLAKALEIWLEHGWQPAFPDCEFRYHCSTEEIMVLGDPNRIRQMIDKLIENGVSFHNENSAIEIALHSDNREVILTIANEGPTIPDEIKSQIFGSMVSRRSNSDNRPHLGLGLYVARTIVLHHKGTIEVANLADGREGVSFTLRIPRS